MKKRKVLLNVKEHLFTVALLISREEGIRTLDTVTRILAFQASSFNHSDTSLCGIWRKSN
jgi:hypothetical protein